MQEGRATVNQDTRLDNRVIDLRVSLGLSHPLLPLLGLFCLFYPLSGIKTILIKVSTLW